MTIRRAAEKDIPQVLALLSQVLELHAEIRPDIFIPGTTKYTTEELAAMLKDETRRILHVCLEGIDPQIREALWLVYFEDMSYAQAGMVMNVNTKKIDHLLDKGKKRLRAELEKEGISNAYE